MVFFGGASFSYWISGKLPLELIKLYRITKNGPFSINSSMKNHTLHVSICQYRGRCNHSLENTYFSHLRGWVHFERW